MTFAKVSICLFFLRVTVVERLHVWIVWAIGVTTVVLNVVYFFLLMFQCRPISFFWNKNQEGSCLSPDIVCIMLYMYSASSVIADLTLVFLPLAIVWKLQMPLRTKLTLAPIMLLGLVYVFLLYTLFLSSGPFDGMSTWAVLFYRCDALHMNNC